MRKIFTKHKIRHRKGKIIMKWINWYRDATIEIGFLFSKFAHVYMYNCSTGFIKSIGTCRKLQFETNYHENTKSQNYEIFTGFFRGFVLSCLRDENLLLSRLIQTRSAAAGKRRTSCKSLDRTSWWACPFGLFCILPGEKTSGCRGR